MGPRRERVRGRALTTNHHRGAAIVGIANTEQARSLPGHDSRSIALEAAIGALGDAGIAPGDVDGVVGQHAAELVHDLRLGPCVRQPSSLGIPAVLDALDMVGAGRCRVVVVAAGGAGLHAPGGAVAAWTRPAHEFVEPFGLFTAAEFALLAREHMLRFGTTAEQLATAAAIVRNNGHAHPGAVYHGRGPFEAADVLASPVVADPFHLLECATTSEGGAALVVASADLVDDLRVPPAWVLGAGSESFGPAYQVPPVWTRDGQHGEVEAGYVGRNAARRAFSQAGLGPDDVDVAELYDPFSFELIRQLEAFGFCADGEGGELVMSGAIGPGGRLPITTDGGTMSYSHAGISTQMLQRVTRGVEQLRGTCESRQVDGAEVALCSNGGAGALFSDVMVLGRERR